MMNFEKTMPGYEAEVIIYDAEGSTFMLVKDAMGDYIYSWPDRKRLTEGKKTAGKGLMLLAKLAKAIKEKIKRNK